jgi:hypothetical protein
MKMKYQRGGRAGKLHNMAMRMRKNKPQRFNPFKEELLKKEFMEQMKLLAQQNNTEANIENMEDAINFAKSSTNITEPTLESEHETKEQSDESRTP